MDGGTKAVVVMGKCGQRVGGSGGVGHAVSKSSAGRCLRLGTREEEDKYDRER